MNMMDKKLQTLLQSYQNVSNSQDNNCFFIAMYVTSHTFLQLVYKIKNIELGV